jgi:PRTRC genetic system protein E
VNVLPKKLADGENAALTTPMSFIGTAAELDAQLPDAIVGFVASHLELKNTLGRAKEEMATAAKAAQDEARSKLKTTKKAAPADLPVKKGEQKTAESPKAPNLFDAPALVSVRPASADSDEEAEILAEMNENEETEEEDEAFVAS